MLTYFSELMVVCFSDVVGFCCYCCCLGFVWVFCLFGFFFNLGLANDSRREGKAKKSSCLGQVTDIIWMRQVKLRPLCRSDGFAHKNILQT